MNYKSFFLLLLCFLQQAFAVVATDSIRIIDTRSLNNDSWDIHLQQCFNQNVQSCEILIKDGLKSSNECHIKKECVVIGEIYWNANQFKNALQYFERACNAKNMQGCYFVGLDYEKQGNIIKAKDYFQMTCDKKNMQGCFKLGNFYEEGIGLRQDYKQASILYKKACKNKHAQSCCSLGNLYQEGNALVHDLSLAKEFYGKACDLGLQKGCDEYKKLNQAGIPSLYVNKNVFD
ncbi:sel1 repeat family protein [Helicobacter didelphidarum]|uniref:Beta-lactamase n=1 Tax=Helicobacter didelphidarum TaxID=2040648 RepID=A0A3D8II92_9HELI|nr:tetratricopeptide repeat protein [Helicobacter didelphidarum]RDU64626.1 sel1 repeat family protein [Helicobacter didelphidarum]